MTHPWLDRLSSFELALCQRCNQRAELLPTQQFYRVVSRLGDGVFWYLLMALLPIKMICRWSFNLNYFVAIPEYFFNF